MLKIMDELENTMEVLEMMLETKASMIVEELISNNRSLSDTMDRLYIETEATTIQYIEFYNVFFKEYRKELFNDSEEKSFQEALYSRIKLFLNEKTTQFLINEMKKLA